MEVLELGVSTASRSAAEFARKLIDQGKVSRSKVWDGPSATTENAYLNTNGWDEFGKWYLGRNDDAPEETKGRYTFPFTDDFKTVSVNGLRAIRQRAGQQDDQGIFKAAGPLFADAVKEKMEARSEKLVTFGGASGVDFENGILNDVTLVEEGEARGHGIICTERTLQDAVRKLAGKSLPAYITHANAQGDRLTSEVGFFQGFYLDGGSDPAPYGSENLSLKARTFTAFESFKKYQPETFERLFEMAQTLPDNFGISLVFEAALAWEMPDGMEPYVGMAEKPEGSLYDFPTVEMTSIQSADFVDNPAATSSLFSEPTPNQNQATTMNETETVELTTAASDELERRRAEEAAGSDEKSEPTAKKKTKKKKLSEDDAEEATSEDTEVLAQQEVIDDLEIRLTALTSELDNQKAEVEKLRSFMEGGEEIEEDAAPESTNDAAPVSQLKAEAVTKILDANPKFSRSQALLEVGKAHPEFFTMKTTNPLN